MAVSKIVPLSLAFVIAMPNVHAASNRRSHSAEKLGKSINKGIDIWSDDATLRANPRSVVGAVGIVYADAEGRCSEKTEPVFRWQQIIVPVDKIDETVESEPVRRYVNNSKIAGKDDLPFVDIEYDDDTAHEIKIDDRAAYRLKWDQAMDDATVKFLAAYPEFTDATKVCKVVAVQGVVVRRFYYKRYRKVTGKAEISWVLDGNGYTSDENESYTTRYGLHLAVVWWNRDQSSNVVPTKHFEVKSRPTKKNVKKNVTKK